MKKLFYLMIIFFLGISISYAEEQIIVEVETFEQLNNAIVDNSDVLIKLKNNVVVEKNITISTNKNVTIEDSNYVLMRSNGYTGSFFTISEGVIFKLESVNIDGGAADWKVDFDNSYFQSANNKGTVYTPVISSENDVVGTASLIVNNGHLTLKNVDVKNVRSTANGSVLSGKGSNVIDNSIFEKIFSSKSGGAMYITGGETQIISSAFKECMVGEEKKSIFGGALQISNGTLNISKNSLFENNYASANGGAIQLSTSNINITDTIFKNNRTGNDGAAIVMSNGTIDNKVKYENVVFDGNYGMANTGQSLGVIYLSSWKTADSVNEEDYIRFINVEFKNNNVAAGSIADRSSVSSVILFDNCKIYDNNTNGAAAIFSQGAKYIVRNTDIYNNYGGAYGVIRIKYGPASLLLDNVNIYNNDTPNYGGAMAVSYGDVVIKNSKIYNNKSGGNGTILINSTDSEDGSVSLKIENTILNNNTTDGYGGGVYIQDENGGQTTFSIDEKSKIYSNKSNLAGDDFVYVNKNVNTTDDLISLNDANSYNINGIDGWYFDNESDRYSETDLPSEYEKGKASDIKILYLKAAGDAELSYDLNGGTSSKDYTVEHKRYGSEFDITDDKPVISNGTFIGWNTKPDGSGYWFYDVDKYNGEYGKILYAQYKYEIKKEPAEVNPDTLSGEFISVLILGIVVGLILVSIYIYVALRKSEKDC